MSDSSQPADASSASVVNRDPERIDPDIQSMLRCLPSVDAVVAAVKQHGAGFTDEFITNMVRSALERERTTIRTGAFRDGANLQERITREILELDRPRLRPLLNATGVIIHTNLGRAPVSPETAAAMQLAASSAVALEIDPESNDRGGRMAEIARLMLALTGAEATLIVNNGAAAVLLALSAVASGKEVVVSRGEAIEIGGGFRIPDVMRQSGARLIEVGTTNRTYVSDYAAATSDQTAAYLKVHPSNFRVVGFVHAATTHALSKLGRERGVPILEDLGSGALLDTAQFGLASEPTLSDSIGAGADLVIASGDKLLGGPQAGIIAGSRRWVEVVSRHPLARAVRADKTCLAGIAATLRHYAKGQAETRIPVWRMIAAREIDLRERAQNLVAVLATADVGAAVAPVISTVGGGSLPGETLPGWGVVLTPRDGDAVDALARRLRLGEPRVFGRIERNKVVCDVRTVLPEDDDLLTDAIRAAWPA